MDSLEKAIEQLYSQVRKDESDIQKTEEAARELYKAIVSKASFLVEVSEKRTLTDFMGELKKFIDQLKLIKERTRNDDVSIHVTAIIVKMQSFMPIFYNSVKKGIIATPTDRKSAVVGVMKNTLRPLLEDIERGTSTLDHERKAVSGSY